METQYILYGLIIGITSNLHCIGMCGPIALAIPLDRSSNFKLISGILQYNFGRILTYSVLGLIVGSIGVSLGTFGILQWISITAGALLILFAWRKYFGKLLGLHFPDSGVSAFVGRSIGKVLHSGNPLKLVLLGTLNGLLPCSMVYIALMNALLPGNMVEGALAMVAFGAGTLPSMIAVAFAANKISNETRNKLNRAVPYLLTLVGALIILRGMNLNIPFVSPAIKTVKTEQQVEKVEMSCCHSKDTCEK